MIDRAQRIGRRLHDSLYQHLTAIAFIARACRPFAQREKSGLGARKISGLINDAVTEAQAMARGCIESGNRFRRFNDGARDDGESNTLEGHSVRLDKNGAVPIRTIPSPPALSNRE